MGYVLFERLCELSARFRPQGRTMMLGRHAFVIEERFTRLYEAALKTHGIAHALPTSCNPTAIARR